MKQTKHLVLLLGFFMFLGIQQNAWSQGVTTSAIEGMVMTVGNEPLADANVVAVHEPTGTRYGTTTRSDGRFNIPNVRVGGPYTITVSYVGYETDVISDLRLSLGETRNLLFLMVEAGQVLQEVIVSATAGSVGQTTGTSTNIDSEDISTLPSINRNLNDFLRLTPQSGAYGGGISFAGTNNRYNAIYIDGAVNNDVFGLASSGTNGGQTGISPFSPDIIEQFQVVLSPYDVTMGGFAGGGVNAVTKSGTNTYKATGYTYFKNQSLVGKTNGVLADRLDLEERERVDDFNENVYGVSLGGPIIRDRMFIFTNIEIQRDETPRPFDITEYTSVDGRVSSAELENLRNHLINTYDYDPGSFGSTAQNLNGLKIFAKIDYNVTDEHRLTLRHQYTKAEQFNRFSGNRNTVNFSNNGIYFPSTTNSSALELNSRFGTDYSNNLIIGYTRVRDNRSPLGKNFPYVYIDDENSGLIRFGSEEFSTANQLDQDILTLTNNFNIYRGAHKITLGTHNEFYSIYNLFIRQNFGVYRFSDLDAFLNNEPAYRYTRNYSLVDDITGGGSAAAADFSAIQLGIYGQDEWSVNRQLTITAGLRIDLPIITSDPTEDTYFNQTALPQLQAAYPIAEGAKAGQAPDGQIMLSPRLGFTYDVTGDGMNTIRGGAGIFTSRIPFVWPGAMFNNNGLTQGQVQQGDIEGDVFFNPQWDNQPTNPNFSIPSGQMDLFVEDFKYPQVFRTNLGYDFKLPGGIDATLEGLYTKTLNNILYTNINSDPTVDFTWTNTPDNRKVFVNSSIDPTYSAVYLASNTSEGYTYNLSGSLAKDFDFGLRAVLAYSYGDAYALSEGTSSQNSSQWRGQVSIDGRNNPEFGRSDFAVGHRVLSSFTYGYNWTRDGNNRTTVSLFLNGQSGTPYSYVISGSSARNLNAERGSTSRNRSLAYIPASASEINLVDYEVDGTVVTAAEQWANLNSVIEDDKYLSENKGGYAEKNGAWSPFATIFDVAIRHDFGLNLGGQRHRFQISVDIANFGNMLNSEWGTQYSVPGDFNNYYLYQFEGYADDGTTPQFTFRDDRVGLERFNIQGLSSRWSMLFGVKYMFN
ncbi:MAG: carboxypeptidase regulatory-like domain-containing protein [Bacteroidales bacterium]